MPRISREPSFSTQEKSQTSSTRNCLPEKKIDNFQTQPTYESRKYDRIKIHLKVIFQIEGKEVSGTCSDFSTGGLRLYIDFFLEQGTPLSINLSLGNICFLKLSGSIVFCFPSEASQHTAGVRFSTIRPWNLGILNSVIGELKNNASTASNSFGIIYVSKDVLALEASSLSPCGDSSTLSSIGHHKERSHHHESRKSHSVPKRKSPKNAKAWTPNPPWVTEMMAILNPFRNNILNSKLVQGTSTGDLSLSQVRGWLIQFYPFVEQFPQFMGSYLAKAPDEISRSFLIDNLRVEKRHAKQWIDMALGFGVTKQELFHTDILPSVEALSHWMWSITNRGSFAEAMAAVNFSIEGITQGIAASAIKGFHQYNKREDISLPQKAYHWMEAHSIYDDIHPLEALEIIKIHASSEELQQKVIFSGKRSLQYLLGAVEACYWGYQPDKEYTPDNTILTDQSAS